MCLFGNGFRNTNHKKYQTKEKILEEYEQNNTNKKRNCGRYLLYYVLIIIYLWMIY
jgi:hypothetical protein